MANDPTIQYLGCTVEKCARAYSFMVRDVSREPRHFTVSISAAAFDSRRARFQDGPDICYHRLQRALDTVEAMAGESSYQITDEELDDYRLTHTAKTGYSSNRPKPPKPSPVF